jgi:hypothetical protein
MHDLLKKSYVYKDKEVYLTGRVATRQVKRTTGKIEQENVVEIRPIDAPDSIPAIWVKISELFEIREIE